MSTGPFDLAVGEEVSFSFSIIFGQNIDDLLRNAYFAQIMYNSHYQGYTPPATPNVMAVAGHNQVELYWDDKSIQSRDVITGYSDFEGYKIYRSIDGGETWGSVEDEIIIENDSKGWQPLSIGCFDNPDDTAIHTSECRAINTKLDCIYSDFSVYKRRDADGDGVDDCYWKYAQFDLSAEKDTLFCIYGEDDNGICNTTIDCESPCRREADVQGPDHLAEWFSLGYNTGLEILLQDSSDASSVYTITDYDTGELSTYKYRFIDKNVMDGIEYSYSVVAYDRGVSQEVVTFYPSDDGDISYTRGVTSIPDPGNWGEINPFEILESPKGTTIHDPNFVQVIPGYPAATDINLIQVVPNPYIVHSDYNETEYKRRIRFTRLPPSCTITIFTISGEKVRELEHNSATDGNEWWDLRSYNNQEIAPGLYIYVVEAPGVSESKIGKFAIVR